MINKLYPWIVMLSLQFTLDANAQMQGSTRDDFLRMANYLSAGSGKWMALNPDHKDDNPKSARGYGLWFEFRLRENLLQLNHISYIGDTAHVTGESIWLWHPGEQRIRYYSINVIGSLAEGETYFISKDTFVTYEYRYNPGGLIQKIKDENIIINDTVHKAGSLILNRGEWNRRGQYEFKRSPEAENYKAIKQY